MKALICFLLCVMLTGCGRSAAPLPSEPSEQGSTQAATEPAQSTTPSVIPEALFSQRDYETGFDESKCAVIQLSDNGSTAGKGVNISGNTVTVTQEGCYLLRGRLSNAMILVDTDKNSKVQLILDGVSLHCESSAPIYVRQADKVFITLAEDSENTLSTGESFTGIDDNNIDSAIFSKEDLTLNGNGKLTLTCPAGHGIVSKDTLRITGGSYAITAAGHGITAQDQLSIARGSFTIQSGKDGLHAENDTDTSLGNIYLGSGSFQITAAGDGISAGGAMTIDNGAITLLCGEGHENGKTHTGNMMGGPGGHGGMGRPGDPWGGNQEESQEDTVSCKGLKAAGALTLNGGSFSVDSADDSFHSNSDLTVNGGIYQISTGDDGFHADGHLQISNGAITITESYEGIEGLTIDITGGEITLKASDDGLNAAGGNDQSGFGGPGGMGFGGDMFRSSSDSYIQISGGALFVDADGDGIDSNGDLRITGGYTVVEGPTGGGNGALDYGGSGSISGGTALISGSVQMAQSLSATGAQGVLAINTGTCSGGTKVLVTDASGNTVMELTPQKDFGCVILSAPELGKGQPFTVTINGQTAEFTAE